MRVSLGGRPPAPCTEPSYTRDSGSKKNWAAVGTWDPSVAATPSEHRTGKANAWRGEELSRGEKQARGGGAPWGRGGAPWGGAGRGRPTDGAVLAVPALAAFTLAVPAGAVLGAARVAGSLTARWARPAFFTAASAPHADAVQAAVRGTDLWGEKERKPGRRGEQRRVRRGAREKRFVSNSARQQGEEQSRWAYVRKHLPTK